MSDETPRFRERGTPPELLAAAGAGAYEHSADLSSGSFSRRFAEVHGYQPDDIPPWPGLERWYLERLYPDDRERYRELLAEFLAGRGERFGLEVRFRTRRPLAMGSPGGCRDRA